MDLKNMLTPWNWFKKEQEQQQSLRPHRGGNTATDHPPFRVQRDIDRLFDELLRGFPWSPLYRSSNGAMSGVLHPHLDISENNTRYTVTVEVPGIEEKDIELTVADGNLMIQGEKRSEKENREHQYHCIERSYGAFKRVLSLPTDVDETHIDARFKNGVLTIIIPKNPEAKPSRRIAIRS